LMRVIPKHLSLVAIAIEVTQDLSKLILDDVGGRLRAVEDHAEEDDALPPPRVDGKLLLREEQWKEKASQRSDVGQGSFGGGGDARASVTTVGRRTRSVMTSATTAAAPAIGQEIAASQRRNRRI
jgi:hypothetical protein